MRQLEAEADAIIQMVREGQRARRLTQAPPPTASSASAAVTATAGSSVVAPHAPTGAAPPAGTAAAATVSMGRTDSRHTHCRSHLWGNLLITYYDHHSIFVSKLLWWSSR